MKKEKFNQAQEESIFFIAKLNDDPLWSTEAPTVKKCINNLCTKLNVKSESFIPTGAGISIIQIKVSQSLIKEFP